MKTRGIFNVAILLSLLFAGSAGTALAQDKDEQLTEAPRPRVKAERQAEDLNAAQWAEVIGVAERLIGLPADKVIVDPNAIARAKAGDSG
ncbi:MAG: hypothetical protein ACE5JS_20015 [Nitrospinota bacterium]